MHGGGVASGGSVARGKRKTSHQLAILQKTYAENSFPSEQLRTKLSVQLNLTYGQVDNWFCYRRSKDERWSCYRRSKDKKGGSDKIGYNPWRKRNTNNCTPKKKLKCCYESSDSDSDAPFKKKQCGLVDNVSPMPDSSSDSDAPFKKKQCGLVDNVSPMPDSIGYNMGETKRPAWRNTNTNNCTLKKKLKSSDSEDASDSDVPFKKKQCGLVDNVSPMPISSSDSEDASASDNSSDSDDADVLLFKKKHRVLVDKVSPMPNSSSDSDVGALFKKKHRELVDSVSPMSDCLLDGGGGVNIDGGGDGELLVPKPEQCELAENVSPMSDSLEVSSSYQSDIVCIQGYKVKRSNATVLEAIIKKHGDIAVNCVFKTDSVRSSILEVVCEVVRRIQTDDVIEMGEDIERQLSDAESANINVSWIRAHFEAFNKRKETSKTYSLLTEMKLNTVLVKRAAQMDLRDKSAKLVAAQEEFKKVESCVRVLHLVEKNLNDNILESKSKLDSWVKPPVV